MEMTGCLSSDLRPEGQGPDNSRRAVEHEPAHRAQPAGRRRRFGVPHVPVPGDLEDSTRAPCCAIPIAKEWPGLHRIPGAIMKIGMIGLGRMGGNMAERLRRHGHEVIGFDHDPAASKVASLADLAAALPAPRVVWVMVPSGDADGEHRCRPSARSSRRATCVIEGGNSFYRDSIRRAGELGERGIGFVDAGTSGGIWGLAEGYCIMAGGDPTHIAIAQPIFDALAQPGGFAHVGPVGAGHFTKMVHNGVEYGMMQAFGEGYELLRQKRARDRRRARDRGLAPWQRSALVAARSSRQGARRRPEARGNQGLGGGFRRGSLDGAGGGAPRRARARALGVALRALRLAPGGCAHDESDRRVAQPVRRTCGKEVTCAPREIPASSSSSAPPAT